MESRWQAAALTADFSFPSGGDVVAGAQTGLPDNVVMGFWRGTGGCHPSHTAEGEKMRSVTTLLF